MREKKSWWHRWEMTINTDWITTIGLALILIACGAILILEIRHFASGTLRGKSPPATFVNFLIPVCYFLGAFESRIPKLARISLFLLGTDFAARLAMGYLHGSVLLHEVAITGSILRQAALTLVLLAILFWFKSAVKITPLAKSDVNRQQMDS